MSAARAATSSRSFEPGALHLSVQYAVEDDVPSRAQLRRWVAATLAVLTSLHHQRFATTTLAFRFVAEDEGRALNRTFRGKDYATNVLTFPFDDAATDSIEADIVICVPVVAREASEQDKARIDHCAHLVVHGTLHACGYDHEAPHEAEAMEAVERAVLKRFRIADPYRVDV